MKKKTKYNTNEIRYFNTYEFDNARKLGYVFGMDAKEAYEEYFLKYPKDYTSYVYYAAFLIKNRELDEALKILDYVLLYSKNDSKFVRNGEKVEFIERFYVINKMKILLYKGCYQEALDLYDEQYELVKDHIGSSDAFILYCQKMVGTLDLGVERDNIKSYLYRQIVEYKEDDFRDHIKKHLADDAAVMEDASPAIFVPDFPIDDVIEEIRKYIPSNKCIYPGGFEDAYTFKYDECGRDKYCLTDYFKVFCFHDTKDIITISPSIVSEVKFACVDLNYLRKKVDCKVKRKTQVEKFYSKYGNR